MTVSVQFLFLTVPWIDLQCVIMAFLGQTHLLFESVLCTVGKVCSPMALHSAVNASRTRDRLVKNLTLCQLSHLRNIYISTARL